MHLHRLKDADLISSHYLVADPDRDRHHQPRHGASEYPRSRRRPGAGMLRRGRHDHGRLLRGVGSAIVGGPLDADLDRETIDQHLHRRGVQVADLYIIPTVPYFYPQFGRHSSTEARC